MDAHEPAAAPHASIAPAPEAARLLRAINRASRYGLTRPACLVRALALSQLMTAGGLTGAVVRIGVRWANGEFVAHAWVEHEGAVLDLEPALSAPFSRMTRARLAGVDDPTR
jgi:hypothetical protein